MQEVIVKYQLRWCEINYSVNCEIKSYRFLWNEINPHAARRISHCVAIFHARSVFHKSWKDLFRWKKHRQSRCFFLEAPPRFELGNKAFAELCLTTWLWRHTILYVNFENLWQKTPERLLSLERKTRFELATFTLARWRSTTEPLPQLVPPGGIEPPTRGFSVPCSTDWATEAYE